MLYASWAKLCAESEPDTERFKGWNSEEKELWEDWDRRWFQYDDIVEDRVSGLKMAERLEEIFDARTPYSSLHELEVATYREVCIELGLIWSDRGTEQVEATTTPREPTPYAEDDFDIDWSNPVIIRGEKRNGDGGLFYLYVPWALIPGNELRTFLRGHVGIAKGYQGLSGFKLDGTKYMRTLPIAGQVDKQPTNYLDAVVRALLDHTDATLVQERIVTLTQSQCTGSCRNANYWTPCECICKNRHHGGANHKRRTEYTITEGNLIIDGFRDVSWILHTETREGE